MSLEKKKDEELFREMCAGNEQSSRELHSIYAVRMLRQVRWKYRFNETDFDDIVNGIWEKLWKACGKNGPNENFGGYLWKSLENQIIDYERKNNMRGRYFQEDSPDLEDYCSETIASSAEDLAINRQELGVADDCLAQLPAEQREAFVLNTEEGSIAKTAARLGITVEAVKSRVRRATAKLKECLPRGHYEKNRFTGK